MSHPSSHADLPSQATMRLAGRSDALSLAQPVIAQAIAPGQTKPSRPRVLMLTTRMPYPLDRGDRIRAYHLLERLSRRCDVSLACVSDTPADAQDEAVVEQLTHRYARRPINARHGKLRSLVALACGRAATPSYFYRHDLAAKICQWHVEQPFDAVLTYCTGMVNYSRDLFDALAQTDLPRPRHMIDLVDVDSAKWAEYADKAHGLMRWVYNTEAKRLRKIEAGERDTFDSIVAVSDAEIETFRRTVCERQGLATLRHAVDADRFMPIADAGGCELLFVGTLNYHPNVEGIVWFANHVMPGLLERQPKAKLRIVGRSPCEEVLALNALPGVEVVGSVPDVRPYMAKATVIVAPLLLARGVQSKVLEAMSTARAVVCSPASAEGIAAKHAEQFIIANDPSQWIAHLHELLSNPALRQSLGMAARRRIETHYRWEACLEPLETLLLGEQTVAKLDAQNAKSIAPLRAAA